MRPVCLGGDKGLSMMTTGLKLPAALTATMLWATLLAAGGTVGCSAASSTGGAAGHDATEATAGRDGGAGQGGVGAAGIVGADACAATPDPADAGATSDGGDEADAGGSEASAACAACELASSDVSCEPDFLTSTRDAQGTPIGWGTGTSQTEAERETGEALLHCIIVNACSANPTNDGPGNNAVLGCFCGPGVKLEACLSGAGIHGACIAAYEAAAAATPTGPPACSSIATFAYFIASVATNVKSPIGLADNVASCAFSAPCPVCETL
jgi:hypothetical protein